MSPRRPISPGGTETPRRQASHRVRSERFEEERLAPFARKSARASRRHPLAGEGRAFDYRTEYQRDRDRLIHSRSFRRLAGKRDFQLADVGDHYRNRQTHSLEVSQLGGTMARALRLNEDLVEAVALAHDLGTPPLGGGGGEALNGLLGGGVRIDGFSPEAGRALGGFDVPSQSLRVVDLLEKRYDHPGLNLTDDARAGIWKQGDPDRTPAGLGAADAGLDPGVPPSAEAQVVRLACRIAAAAQGLDDLLRARPPLLDRAGRLGAVRQLDRKLGKRHAGSHFMRLNVIHRGLTHLLVSGAIHHTERALSRWAEREKVETTERFYRRRGAFPPDGVGLPERVRDLLAELEAFVATERGRSREHALARRHARTVVEGLFRVLYSEPAVLEDYVLLRFRDAEKIRYLRDVPPAELEREVARHYRGSPRLVRMIGDHVAGMTDSYAEAEHRRLCRDGEGAVQR